MIIVSEDSRQVVLAAIQENEARVATNEEARKQVAIDHYKHNVAAIENDISEWFKSKIFKVVPVFVQKIVPRFTSAKVNVIYKRPPKRLIAENQSVKDKEKVTLTPNSDYYKKIAYKLDVKQKTHAEMTWLLGKCALYSGWNDLRKRLEYKVIGVFNEYYLEDDLDNVWGISYEISKRSDGTRRFVFWSEARGDNKGDYFVMDAEGEVEDDIDNTEHENPYGILPFTIAEYETNAMDVVSAAIQIDIAMTQLALGGRFNLGLLWTDASLNDVLNDEEDEDEKEIDWDILNILEVPEGRTVGSVKRGGDLKDNVEIIKAFYSTTAENNNMSVKFEQRSGKVFTGAALRIIEIENNDTLEAILPFWNVVEKERYEKDRVIINVKAKKDLPEEININFASVDSGLTEIEKQKIWDWRFKRGGTIRDYYLETDPDISEVELNRKVLLAEEIMELELNFDVENSKSILEARKQRIVDNKKNLEESKL